MSKKLQTTLQIAQTECGLCCTRTILDHFNYQISITELRKIEEPGRDGLNFKQIKNLLQNYHIDSNIYKVNDIKGLSTISFPIIAFWKGYHFVCVESLSGNGAIIMDPSIGRLKISLEEFKKDFYNYILIPHKGKKFTPKKKGILSKWKKNYIWPPHLINTYARVFIVSLALVAITIMLPLVTQYLIDNGFSTKTSFVKIIMGSILATLFFIVLLYLKNELSIKIIYSFNWNLISKAFTRLLMLPIKYFTVRAPGEISYRLNSLKQIQSVLGNDLVQSCINFISSLLLIIYIFHVSITLGFFVLILLFFTTTFLVFTHSYLNTATDRELHESSKAQNTQLDAFVSINSVKLGGYIKEYLNDWKDNFKHMMDAMTSRIRIQDGIISSVILGIQIFGPLTILIISLQLVNLHIVSLGQALAVETITSLIFSYSTSIFNTFINFSVATKYLELADDIFEYTPEKINKDSKLKVSGNRISLKDISFKYSDNEKNIISNINFDILPGETIAIVGLSGSGKTTLGKVISSLFEPNGGKIFFENHEYKEYNLEKLRSVIGYIPQESHLHNRTILQNFKLNSKDSDEKIIEFCRSLKFLDFIDDLPMGYTTVVSEMGGNLSGGQRQRIQIAKSLLQKPKLLIMDEATSSLDNISQMQVYKALTIINCSKVIIAHRLETVLNANKILVLSQSGKQVQFGTHKELIKQKGIYNDLYNNQIQEDYGDKI